MRVVWLVAVALCCGAAQCDRKESDACGLKTAQPDIPPGSLQATRDGNPYTASCGGGGSCGWRGTDRLDIMAGDVQLYIGRDQDGQRVDEAINAGDFPICVLLNDQSDGTTYAFVMASNGSFITDSTHTGTVAILGKEGDQLIGRFEFEAKQNSGSGTTRLEDGSFRLGPR